MLSNRVANPEPSETTDQKSEESFEEDDPLVIDFDFDSSAEQHFIRFKAETVGKSLAANAENEDDFGDLDPVIAEARRAAKAQKSDTGMVHIKKQAIHAQKENERKGGKRITSAGALQLDITQRECEFMSNQLGLNLVQLRQKLKPFIDEGVIYKDRKQVNKKLAMKALQAKEIIVDVALETNIAIMQQKID